MKHEPFDVCPTCGYSMRKRGQVKEMVELTNDGLTVIEIADRLGVSQQAVRRGLKRRGVKPTTKWSLAHKKAP